MKISDDAIKLLNSFLKEPLAGDVWISELDKHLMLCIYLNGMNILKW